MQWLIHGTLTPAVAEALRRHEHQVHLPAELELDPAAPAHAIIAAAHRKQWDLLTNDEAMVTAMFEDKPLFKRSLVYLQLAGGDVEQDDAIDRLFARYKRLSPGRMYTITESRVKIRQLPGV